MERIFFCLLVMIASVAYAQSDKAQKLMQFSDNVERFACKYPQERVYLHFDNTSYYKGEHIWYKANVVRGDNLHATPLSRILYVELVSPIGFPLETQKLVIENGQAHGSFLLKDTLNAGFYEVRAYTAWMLNFTPGEHHGWDRFTRRDVVLKYGERFQNFLKGNAGIFSRVFPVYDAVKNGKYGVKTMIQPPKMTSDLSSVPADKLKLKFYPEGGNLVAYVPTRVAFEACDANGKLVNVSGAMIQHGDTIGRFGSVYAGKGLFTAVPDSNDGYSLIKGLQLKVRYHGDDYMFSLPKAKRKGYVLNVDNRHEKLKTMVARNNNTDGDLLGLMITCRGRVEYSDTVDMRSALSQSMTIDRKLLKTGVNIFTLYQVDGNVVAQREVFVNNHDMNVRKILCYSSQNGYCSPYQKMSIDLQLTDSTGHEDHHVETLSVAVTDSTYRDVSFDNGNAMTDLLLSSEIKGFVPYPAYYFEKDDEQHRAALDLLLMVQGWTRYDFKQMSTDTAYMPQYKIERGLSFSGRVYNDHYQSDVISLNDNYPISVGSNIHSNHVKDFNLDSGEGYGDFSTWSKLKKEIYITSEIALRDSELYGEALTKNGGEFEFNIPKFYGKSNIFMMMNKRSAEVIGEKKAGILGHLVRETALKQNVLENKYVLVPMNAYPPLAKPYNIYETLLPDDYSDSEFGEALTPFTQTKNNKDLIYDPASHTFMVREVVKKARRKWNKVDLNKPILVVGVRDLMTYMSNIQGRVSSFTSELIDQSESSNPVQMLPMLYGFSGTEMTYINGHGLSHYRKAYGNPKNAPKGMELFPPSENFSRFCLYADASNRDLMYRHGLFSEQLSYQRNNTSNSPLTVRMNFITDSALTVGAVHSKFIGNKMMIQGISQPAEFYSPDYSTTPLPQITDYRRTVYWNPDVRMDENGKAHLEFYNNGFTKRMVISAEGIDSVGNIFSAR
jgi:hypothetical protein